VIKLFRLSARWGNEIDRKILGGSWREECGSIQYHGVGEAKPTMIFVFLRNVALILRWKTSIPKPALLLTYLRISLKYALLVRLLGRSLTKDRIFGYHIRFFDYETFKLVFEEVFINEEYRFQPVTPSPRIIDCGANIGLAVFYFKMLNPRAHITTFEANPRTFELLEQNVRNNGFKNVELLNRAVWDHEGEIPFYFIPNRPGDLGASTQTRQVELTDQLRRAREGLQEGVINVRSVQLSAYLNEPADFVKMDIEGSEDTVIQEVAQSGKMGMIKELVMEYHHHIRPECDRLGEVLRAFETNGFGYQISAFSRFVKRSYQSLLLHAYRK
jgi:FkbM family methyltransferase